MGKGGGSSETPHEAPDDLKSSQMLTVVDAICKGPIEGPVDGLKSVRINKTQALDSDGDVMVHGVTVVYRVGEDEQTAVEGFEDSGTETPLGVEVKKSEPVTRTITTKMLDRLCFTFGVQPLVGNGTKGSRNPTSIQIQIQLRRESKWQVERSITITGEMTMQFLAFVVIGDLPPRSFEVRMLRLTNDSTTDLLQNKTVWSGCTEIIDVKQRYPNTAVTGVKMDVERFGSQRVTRNYLLRGRIVPVLSNYDPLNRTYTGLWDRTFKPAWTDNPARCVLDMLTHPRYGIGSRIGVADMDKWMLYAIAQYCDQPIPDGFDGTEPRITCNTYPTDQRKAWDVLGDFCSLIRYMPVWNGSTLMFAQDRPADKAWTYTQSNTMMSADGASFTCSFSALKERHNAVEVRYTDPNNGWETSTEPVENDVAIWRYGRNALKMDTFACTSRGQAHRSGLWVITTELLGTQTADFSVGAEGLRHVPGDIIEACDSDYIGATVGGRILSVDSLTRTLTLDREVEMPADGNMVLNLVGSDGQPATVAVTAHPAPDRVTVSELPDGVAKCSVWGLKLPDLRRRPLRCVAIQENDDGTYAITAIQHAPGKGAIVDSGATFDLLSDIGITNTSPAMQHLTTEILVEEGQYQVRARWDTPRVVKGVSFSLRLTVRAEDNSDRLASSLTLTKTEHTFRNLTPGRYTLMVWVMNSQGQQDDPASTDFSITAPVEPSHVELTPGYFQITATPRQVEYGPTVQYEFWFTDAQIAGIHQVETNVRYLGTALYWVAANANIKSGKDYYFYIWAANQIGEPAFVETKGQANNDAAGYLNFFKGEITESHLGKELLEKVELTEDNASRLDQFSEKWQDTNGKWNAMWDVKIEQAEDGKHYVAGLGLSMEDTGEGKISQFLVATDRIAFINLANGNETPVFVMQGDQIFMNEIFLKYLTAPTITSDGSPPTFMLTPDGRLTVRNVDISGNISANLGTLSNVAIAENCTINGTLRAENIVGDIVKAVGRAFPGSATHPNGTLTAQIQDDQRFDRQIIIPSITSSGRKGKSETSNEIWTDCGLVVKHNGREIYNATPEISARSFSTVLDMPAGGGNVTLSFTVSSIDGGGGAGASTSSLLVIVMKKSSNGISIR